MISVLTANQSMQVQVVFTVITSDRGRQFNTAFNQALALCLGLTWNMSIARPSQADG